MKDKHLIWIIPLLLVFGLMMGYKAGVYLSIDTLGGMVEKIDECCVDSLDYAIENNNDCKILIVGKMQECYYNQSVS